MQKWLEAYAELNAAGYGDGAPAEIATLREQVEAIRAELDAAGVTAAEFDAAYAGRFRDDVRLNRRYRAGAPGGRA